MPDRATATAPPADAPLRLDVRADELFSRRAHPLVWWGTLVGPLVVTAVAAAAVAWRSGWSGVVGLVGLALSSLFFGKFIILGGADHSAYLLPTAGLFVMVVAMDVMVACWFVFHGEFVRRLPVVGPRVALLVRDGEYVLASYPRLRRVAFLGLVAFVMVPFAMTGSVGGSVLARLLGMRRRAAFVAITLGSILGAGLVYLGATLLPTLIRPDNPAWTVGGAVILVALILLVNHRYSRAKARLGAPHSSRV